MHITDNPAPPALLAGKPCTRTRKDLLHRASAAAAVLNILEIIARPELIGKRLHTDYLNNAGTDELECIREEL